MVTYGPFYTVREITAADGSYRLTGLTTGPYNMMVWDVSGPWVAATKENVKIQAGQIYHLPDFVLTHGALIEGTVKDEATGQPLPGVTVRCYGPYRPRSGIWPATAKTDEKGRYMMHVVAGRCTVSLYRHGYEAQTVKVNLKPGEKKSVSFRVKAEDFSSEDESSQPTKTKAIVVSPQDVPGRVHQQGMHSGSGRARIVEDTGL